MPNIKYLKLGKDFLYSFFRGPAFFYTENGDVVKDTKYREGYVWIPSINDLLRIVKMCGYSFSLEVNSRKITVSILNGPTLIFTRSLFQEEALEDIILEFLLVNVAKMDKRLFI